MGDIADNCFDMTMDDLLYPGQYDEFETFRRSYTPRTSCNRCGKTGVFWLRINGKHVLHDTTTQEPHICQTTTEGFEDEPVL